MPGKELAPVAPRGRPSQYTEDLAQEICDRIAGGETLIAICSEPGMPKEVTVRGWDFDDRKGRPTPAHGFAAMYARALEMRVEHELDRLRILAETPVLGTTVTIREVVTKRGDIVQVREVKRGDAVQARALEIDALKWRIAKIGWHVYGPKTPVPALPAAEVDGTPPRLIIEGGLPDEEAPVEE